MHISTGLSPVLNLQISKKYSRIDELTSHKEGTIQSERLLVELNGSRTENGRCRCVKMDGSKNISTVQKRLNIN